MPRKNRFGFPGLQIKHGLYTYQPPMVGGVRPRLIHLGTASLPDAINQAAEIQRTGFVLERTQPMASQVAAFLTAKAAEGDHKSAATTSTAAAALNRFQAFCRCRATEVAPAKARAWKAAMLAEGLSRASVASYMKYAQSFCSWLVREGQLMANPFDNQKNLFPKSIPTRRSLVCDKATRDRLIDNCDYPPLKAVLYIGFFAGLRRNEILNIRPDWIMRDPGGRPTHFRIQNELGGDGRLSFHVKDSEAKTVPISNRLAEFLQNEYGLDHSPYLIRPDLAGGGYKYRWEWKRRWASYMASQGVPWVTPHTMRHTWFTLLLSGPAEKRPTLLHLSRWSGNSIATIEKHYAHLFEDRDLINAAE